MRALRISLVILAVLTGLFIGADRLAVYLAEQEAADKVKQSQGLSGTESASVDIKGFPFLTQMAGKELDEVDVELKGLTASAGDQRITVTQVNATLTNVHMSGNFSSATADRASGTAKISYEDLNKNAPDGVRVSYAGKERAAKNQVKIDASVSVLGQRISLPAPIYSTVELTENNTLQLTAEKIPDAGITGAEKRIRDLVDFGGSVRGLPDGLDLRKVDVSEGDVSFKLGGDDVQLTG